MDASKFADHTAQKSLQHTDACLAEQSDLRLVQNVLLIWLDSNIDEHDTDYRDTLAQLRHVIHTIKTFTKAEQCIQFLGTIEHEKACMIISGYQGEHVLPQVHNMTKVDSIFIFCGNKQRHEQWAKNWSKIKGIFTDISLICEALRKTVRQCEQDATSISFMATRDDVSHKSIDQLEPLFIYSQIFKEILMSITFEHQHFQQFIQYYHKILNDNDASQSIVDTLNFAEDLEAHYYNKTPICWYTYPYFLDTIVNRALRLMDVNTIIHMSFFISDLHHHIEQLHQEQFSHQHSSAVFTVYRGQGLSAIQFEQLRQTKNGLLSFNNFLTTSKNHQVSLGYAHQAAGKSDLVGVLFNISIDPEKSTTPFASIAKVSYFQDQEDEVLFPMHTVFRIGDITAARGYDRLFEVRLTLTSDDDNDLRQLTDRIRKETFSNEEGWFRLGSLLLKMGLSDKAQEIYEILLQEPSNKDERGRIYHGLARAHHKQGNYKEAITFYEKLLTIQQQTLTSNHLDLTASYNKIGSVYDTIGNYTKALSFYEKALAIRQHSLPSNHPDLADSYSNIGSVYRSMGDYTKALSYYQKDLEISQESLPANHPDLATSYSNIGLVYDNMGEYAKALSYYEKDLEISEQSLPPNHPDLATSYNNIGSTHSKMGDYTKALSYYEKDLNISEQSFPPNHPDLATANNNIGSVYSKLGDYAKALSSYEKALSIYQQSLPLNHPNLAISYNNIGSVYRLMNDYAKALSSYEEALTIRQQSLPPNHPHFAVSYNNIGSVHRNMGDYAKALTYYEQALAIYQKSLSPNHPDLATCYNNIGLVYDNMGDYAKALPYYEKDLEITKQSLPPTHPDLAISYNNIGLMYGNMGDYAKALSFYEQATNIAQQSLPANHPSLQTYKENVENVKKQL